MPKIVEYVNKDDKLTPSSEGESAWTGAGRRIAPAYNEAATLIRESQKGIVQGGQDIASAVGLQVKGAKDIASATGQVAAGAKRVSEADALQVKSGENIVKATDATVKEAQGVERAAGEQTAAAKAQGQAEVLQADQIEKLEKAFLSQYKDLFDIGETGAAAKAKGGGGMGFHTAGGGRSSDPFGIMNNRFPQDYGAGNEILNGATALTSKITGNKGPQFAGGGQPNDPKRLISQDSPFIPGSGSDFSSDRQQAGQGGQTYWGPIGPEPGKGIFSGDPYSAPNNPPQTSTDQPEYYSPIGPNNDSAKGWNFDGAPPNTAPTAASPNWAGQMLGSIGDAITNVFSGGAANAAEGGAGEL
jgi:hypothetical protein